MKEIGKKSVYYNFNNTHNVYNTDVCSTILPIFSNILSIYIDSSSNSNINILYEYDLEYQHSNDKMVFVKIFNDNSLSDSLSDKLLNGYTFISKDSITKTIIDTRSSSNICDANFGFNIMTVTSNYFFFANEVKSVLENRDDIINNLIND